MKSAEQTVSLVLPVNRQCIPKQHLQKGKALMASRQAMFTDTCTHLGLNLLIGSDSKIPALPY